LLTNSEN